MVENAVPEMDALWRDFRIRIHTRRVSELVGCALAADAFCVDGSAPDDMMVEYSGRELKISMKNRISINNN